MNGVIRDSTKAHKRTVKVNPIPTHYEGSGEPAYIKYQCPVCTAVGNDKIFIPKGTVNCPLCGVSLNWDREPEIGDTVVITQTNPQSSLEKGNVCMIVGEFKNEENDEKWYWLRPEKETGHTKQLCSAQAFSILEEDE